MLTGNKEHMHIYDTHLAFLEPLLQELTGFAIVTSGILHPESVGSTFPLGRLHGATLEAPWGPPAPLVPNHMTLTDWRQIVKVFHSYRSQSVCPFIFKEALGV